MTRITVACDTCHRKGRPELILVSLVERERKEDRIRFKTIFLGTMLVTCPCGDLVSRSSIRFATRRANGTSMI